MLVTPPIAEETAIAGDLAAALAAADVAAVLLRLAPADERTLINRVKTLAMPVQDKGAALLLDGHADLVARAGADGAQLTGIDAFMAAREQLKPDRIAGAGGLASRHDAMAAAEAGADYLMFGELEAAGRRPAFAAIEERIAWWAEVFEAPCVGFATTLEEVAKLATTGADFVALADSLWRDPPGPAAAITAAARALTEKETVP